MAINGIWHRVWHFHFFMPTGNAGAKWPADIIEGVGCIQYPTYLLWGGGIEPVDPRIYCFSNRGTTPPLSHLVSFFDNTTSCATYPHLSAGQVLPQKDEVHLYPNPATTTLTITAANKITDVVFSNVLGQIVYTHSYNTDKVVVDISNLPSGIYIIRVNGTDVRKFTKE